jgi:hypothetical protein
MDGIEVTKVASAVPVAGIACFMAGRPRKPSSCVPGTRMTFAGVNNDKDRANVVDCSRTLSSNPVPPPATAPAAK